MRRTTNKPYNLIATVCLSAMMAACGGGGGGSGGEGGAPGPVLITANTPATQVASSSTGVTVVGTGSTSRNALVSMTWTAQSTDPTAPALVLSNEKCDTATKTETPTTNNGGQPINLSNWVCSLGLKIPALTKDGTYNVVLTATDKAGNVKTSTTTLTVKAQDRLPIGQVTVVAGYPQDVQMGSVVEVSCLASGGNTQTGAYQWQWVQASSPDTPIRFATTSERTTSFVAPSVKEATSVNLECRATDDASVTGRATKTVRILPAATLQPKLIADAGKTSTVAPGVQVTLDASATSWYDTQGKPTVGPILNYLWMQTGGPTVAILNPTAKVTTFTVPSEIVERTAITFKLLASAAPITPDSADAAMANLTTTVDPSARLGLTVLDPSRAVSAGASVSIWANVDLPPSQGTVYYSWTQIAGPEVPIAAAKAPNMGFVVPPDATPGTTYIFRVSAGFKPITTDYPGIQSQDVVVTVTK